MDTLTLIPRGERKYSPRWINRRVAFESGKEQVSGVTINPILAWELSYEGTKEMMDSLESFFNAQNGGRKPFYWTDQNGAQYEVRFVNDTLDITQRFGHDENGYGVKGYAAKVQIRTV